MFRKTAITLRALGATFVLGITVAQTAIGAPGAVMKIPTAPAKSEAGPPTSISTGDATVAGKTGAFKYAVPVAVPPGRLGVQPSIGLQYSSQAPIYGGVAAGWTLSGFPEIRLDVSDGREKSDYGFSWAGQADRKWTSDMAGGRRLVVVVGENSGPDVEQTYRAMHDDGYVQYREMISGHPFEWEARKPDGSVIQFGHSTHITGGSIRARAPITRSEDKFGNSVEYYYDGGTDYTPSRIEYTLNDEEGLTAHAMVELDYDAPIYCGSSQIPIGARFDNASGETIYPGEKKLRTIRTLAARNVGAGFRTVREIDLDYSEDSEFCGSRHGAQRQLIGVRERAYDSNGNVTDVPRVSFEYGAIERALTETQYPSMSAMPGAPAGSIVWGNRYDWTYRWPTVEAMMIDLDSDGFQDRLVMGDDATCSYSWERGHAGGFEPGVAMQLPHLPWPENPLGYPAECSFAGQHAYLDNVEFEPPCTAIGSYFSYRFVNLVGQDQRPDLVAALHTDGRYFNSFDDQAILDLGLPLPDCTPGPGECPDFDPLDIRDATTCDNNQVCWIDEVYMYDALDNADRVPCDMMFQDMPIDPQDPQPDPGGGDDQPNCGKNRTSQIRCGQFVWYVWKNLGGGEFASDPEPILSPIPLDSNTGSGALAGSTFGFATGEHGMRDLNGDGNLDVFIDDKNVLLDSSAGPVAWYAWFGDGEGGFHGDGRRDHTPYLWWTPMNAVPNMSINMAGTIPGYPDPIDVLAGLEREGLYDVNGDGLPDLLQLNYDVNKIEVYYNNGLGFVDGGMTFDWWSSKEIGALTSTFTYPETAAPDAPYIGTAMRETVGSPLDLDADGRLDLQIRYSWTSSADDMEPAIFMNAGGQLTDSPIAQTSSEQTSLRERVNFEPDTWSVIRRMTDVTGDGRDDFVDGGVIVETSDDDEPAMRLMRSVHNGRGQTVTVDYTVHTDTSVVTQSPSDGRAMANHTWVVESMTVDDDLSPAGTTSYEYVHPAITPDWRGRNAFRGFEQVVSTGPSGAVTVEDYEYYPDWSGRLFETKTYAGSASHVADQPHTISRTHWQSLDLFDQALVTFKPATKVSFMCAQGQTSAQCEDDPAGQHTTASKWIALGGMMHVASADSEYTGDVSIVGSEVDLIGYDYQPGDRLRSYEHALISTQDVYRVRVEEDSLTALADSSLVALTQYEFDSENLAPEYVRRLVENGTWSTSWIHTDPDTGLVLSKQKAEQLAAGTTFVTTFEHDPHGVFVTRTINELGHIVDVDHDYGTGAVIETRGPNRRNVGTLWESWETRTVSIDGLGRPLEVWTSDDGNFFYAPTSTKRYTYFDGAPSSFAWIKTETLIDGSDWMATTAYFDGSGRQRRQATELAADGLPEAREQYDYDAAGNLVTLMVPDPSQHATGVVEFTYTHDAFGRALTTRNPDGTGTNTSYDGLQVEVTDFAPGGGDGAAIATKRVVSDALGRLVEVQEILDDGSFATTLYEYDVADRMTKAIDPEGNETSIEYDLGGRRVALERGDKRWTYGYDLNDNLTLEVVPHSGIDPDPYTTSTGYDQLDRISSVWAGTAGLSPSQEDRYALGFTSYYYDDCGSGGPCPGSSDNRIGRLRAVELPYATISYDYDARGNAVGERRDFALPSSVGLLADTVTTKRDFTLHGAEKATTYADGATRTSVAFDARGLPREVQWVSSSSNPIIVADIERNVSGNPWTRTSHGKQGRCSWFYCPTPAVQTRAWQYDTLGRVTSDQVQRPQGLMDLALVDYWATGDVKSHTTHTGQTVDYFYDSRHQVVAAIELTASGDRVQSDLAYGPAGRLAEATVDTVVNPQLLRQRAVSYTYGATQATAEQIESLDRLADDSTYASFQYDDVGNLIERTIDGEGTWTMHYDGYGRMRELVHPSGRSEIYYYDHNDTRMLAVELQNSSVQQTRLWMHGSELHYNGNGNQTKSYAHINAGTPVARIENGTELMYTFHNGLGHLIAVTSHTGSEEAAFSYTAFGELYDQSGSSGEYLRRFNGKETDLESGLSYYGFRYYDPLTMTWTRPDPLYQFHTDLAADEPRLLNVFAYSLNNALGYSDPDGRSPCWSSGVSKCYAPGGGVMNFIKNTGDAAVARADSYVQSAKKFAKSPVSSTFDYVDQKIVDGFWGEGYRGYQRARGALKTAEFLIDNPEYIVVMTAEGFILKKVGGAVMNKAPAVRPATQQPKGGNGRVLRDGEGATAAEMDASRGGPTGGSRADQSTVRQRLLDEAGDGPYPCWRCGHTTMDPRDVHVGHRNVPTSRGGNTSPANVCLEGAACNLGSGNRGGPNPGRSCAERGSCGAPYGR